MGLATGCVGMSLSDFERCTPLEFKAVWEAWQEREQQRERGSWERARMVCTMVLQPYAKQALRPRDVLPLPWDDEWATEEPRTELTHEETARRYAAARERFGLK